MRPWRAWCSAAISPVSLWAHCGADGSSSGSGTSAPMLHSAASWSRRQRPCRSGWAVPMAAAARGHRVRLLRDLRHDRELAQRQGPAVRTRTDLLGLHGRHFPGPCGWTAHDRPRADRDGYAIQCDRLPVRRGAGHGEHDQGRAAPDDSATSLPTANSRVRRRLRLSAARSAGWSAAHSTRSCRRGCRARASSERRSRCSCWWRC